MYKDSYTQMMADEAGLLLVEEMKNYSATMQTCLSKIVPKKSSSCQTRPTDKDIALQFDCQDAKSEFMIVDMMDQLMFTISHLGALLPNPELEADCLKDLLTKESIMELVQVEVRDKEMQVKRYELDIESSKQKLYMEELVLKEEQNALKIKELQLLEQKQQMDKQNQELERLEYQKRVVQVATTVFDEPDTIYKCSTIYSMLYAFTDSTDMFIHVASKYGISEHKEPFELIDE